MNGTKVDERMDASEPLSIEFCDNGYAVSYSGSETVAKARSAIELGNRRRRLFLDKGELLALLNESLPATGSQGGSRDP